MRFEGFVRPLLAGALLVLLAACAVPNAPPAIKPAPDRLAQVRTVTVIAPPGPKAYSAIISQHPGYSFGLVGAVIAASDMDTKQQRLTLAMEGQNLALFSTLADLVAAKLNTAGYQASVGSAPAPAPDPESKPEIQADKIESDADTVLVLEPVGAVGFIASTISNSYIPNLAISATLFDRDRKTELYRGSYRTGQRSMSEGWKFTRTPGGFANFETLMQDPAATAAALTATADAIAALIETDLKR